MKEPITALGESGRYPTKGQGGKTRVRGSNAAVRAFPRRESDLEATLAWQLTAAGLFERFEREYRFHPIRKWRVDFYSGIDRLAIEVEGGSWVQGAHVRGKKFADDCDKYNALALAGIWLLRFDNHMIEDGTALRTIEEFIKQGDALTE